jgi:hypothetical protein
MAVVKLLCLETQTLFCFIYSGVTCFRAFHVSSLTSKSQRDPMYILNAVQDKIFEPKMEEVGGGWIMSFINCTPHKKLLG